MGPDQGGLDLPGLPRPRRRRPDRGSHQRPGAQVQAVLQQIHARAPGAKVFVVGYPAILPDSGPGCWRQMPLTYSDVPYLRHEEKTAQRHAEDGGLAELGHRRRHLRPERGFNACMPPGARWMEPGARWMEPVVPVAPAARSIPSQCGGRGRDGRGGQDLDAGGRHLLSPRRSPSFSKSSYFGDSSLPAGRRPQSRDRLLTPSSHLGRSNGSTGQIECPPRRT